MISIDRSPYGIGSVVNPRAVRWSVTFHQWLMRGVSASRTLPTTCVHMCSVAYVSAHSASGSGGQASDCVAIDLPPLEPRHVHSRGIDLLLAEDADAVLLEQRRRHAYAGSTAARKRSIVHEGARAG